MINLKMIKKSGFDITDLRYAPAVANAGILGKLLAGYSRLF